MPMAIDPDSPVTVMAGLVPAIHVFGLVKLKTWMPGTRPGMMGQSQAPLL
jgi:hypothetical protein